MVSGLLRFKALGLALRFIGLGLRFSRLDWLHLLVLVQANLDTVVCLSCKPCCPI